MELVFQSLMTNDTSPVVDFYPVNFDLDLNGKLQEWEAVVLIPFIDEVSTCLCHLIISEILSVTNWA